MRATLEEREKESEKVITLLMSIVLNIKESTTKNDVPTKETI